VIAYLRAAPAHPGLEGAGRIDLQGRRSTARWEAADFRSGKKHYRKQCAYVAGLRRQTISGASKQARCTEFAATNLFASVSITHRQGCSVEVRLQPTLLDKSATDGLNLRLALR
jgi:hypothetical protein